MKASLAEPWPLEDVSLKNEQKWLFFHLQLLNHKNLIFFFYLDFMARWDYFTHFELSQSQGGAKTEDPQEKWPDPRKQNLACLTLTQARLKPTAVRWQAI